jgi:hypothetical protein
VGVWGVGPFDNDTAADWGLLFEAADAGRRAALVRDALVAVVDHVDVYLDSDYAAEAVAAATVVAAMVEGGGARLPSFAPDFLEEPAGLLVSPDLPDLALAALDRVTGENSEWRDLKADDELAIEALRPIRDALERFRHRNGEGPAHAR